jgi:hypothetical protein
MAAFGGGFNKSTAVVLQPIFRPRATARERQSTRPPVLGTMGSHQAEDDPQLPENCPSVGARAILGSTAIGALSCGTSFYAVHSTFRALRDAGTKRALRPAIAGAHAKWQSFATLRDVFAFSRHL